MLKQLKPC